MSDNRKNIESIYPLSPMQRGMLFHSQLDPSSGAYIEQLVSELTGNIDKKKFKESWSMLIQRHGVFRTLFVGLDTDKPLQVVRKHIELPWHEKDWCDLTPDTQEVRLQTYLDTERKQGFNLKRAPLMRLTLIRVSPNRYKFIWTHHHAILDGWSVATIYKELFAYYSAACQGRFLKLPVARPYREYINWLNQQDFSQSKSYWLQYLQNISGPTPIPADRRNKIDTRQSFRPKYYDLVLSEKLSTSLNTLARREQLTLNIIMQGAWTLLLSRYSSEKCIVFGTVVSGRPPELEEVENMVGPFINTVPLQANVEAGEKVLPWLRELHRSVVERGPHEYTALFDIQRWSEIKQGEALFKTLFVFENYPMEKTASDLASGSGLNLTGPQVHDQVNYPLAILIVPDTEIAIRIQYNPDLFNHSTIEQLIDHYLILLEGITLNPRQRLCELSMLTELERKHILYDWNDTKTDYPQNQCIHELFEKQVNKTPDSVAIVYENQQLTYDELNKRSNQLANYLIEQGVGSDIRVGLCMERSPEMVIGTLGILKAGGAYVPIDPEYPEQRIEYLLNDSRVALLLTHKRLSKTIPNKHAVPFLYLDKNWTEIIEHSTEISKTTLSGTNLAYVIYTSGSTGNPKGVAVPHQAVNRLVFNSLYLEFNANRNILQSAPISFDAATFEIWGALLHGGKSILYSERIPTAQKLEEIILNLKINTIWLTTALFNLIVDERPGLLNHVQYVLTGGEAISKDHVKRAYESCNETQIMNMYGPTENTTFTSYHLVSKELIPSSAIPIGKPIGNTSIYILDYELNPVPVGVIGELYTGGEGLARGYLDTPSLTAQKFIPNPFSEQVGERVYRTGDLSLYWPDGDIEFLGRTDHQVKVRGFRIELGEIENVLAEQPGVSKAVVLAHAHNETDQDKFLTAYVSIEQGVEQDSNKLQHALLARLPNYMVPPFFVFLDELPLTPNGKIDRKALPTPDTVTLQTRKYIPPHTDTEKKLVKIWAEVLKIPSEQIGIYSDFFEMGGHSLMAVQAVSRIRTIFSQEMPIHTLFEASSVVSLAQRIDKIEENILMLENMNVNDITDEEAEDLLNKLDTLV